MQLSHIVADKSLTVALFCFSARRWAPSLWPSLPPCVSLSWCRLVSLRRPWWAEVSGFPKVTSKASVWEQSRPRSARRMNSPLDLGVLSPSPDFLICNSSLHNYSLFFHCTVDQDLKKVRSCPWIAILFHDRIREIICKVPHFIWPGLVLAILGWLMAVSLLQGTGSMAKNLLLGALTLCSMAQTFEQASSVWNLDGCMRSVWAGRKWEGRQKTFLSVISLGTLSLVQANTLFGTGLFIF